MGKQYDLGGGFTLDDEHWTVTKNPDVRLSLQQLNAAVSAVERISGMPRHLCNIEVAQALVDIDCVPTAMRLVGPEGMGSLSFEKNREFKKQKTNDRTPDSTEFQMLQKTRSEVQPDGHNNYRPK